MNDDVVHGHGVRGKNSNIFGRHWSQWLGAECDLVDNVGVFLAKGRVVTCNPHEAVLDDQLGKDHVGFYTLYCHVNMSEMMTIWKWLLTQKILDGYALINI